MNWRRVAEVLRLREAVRLMDEREAAEKSLDDSDTDLVELAQMADAQTAAVQDMKAQTRLDSYRRVRIPR